MKSRLVAKTAYQKKLDLKLFEAVGNGNRFVEKFGTPNLDRVKELVRLGATCDHFLQDNPASDAEMLDEYGIHMSSVGYKNAIDYVITNFTSGKSVWK